MKYERETGKISLSLAEKNILSYAESLLFRIGMLSKEGTDIKVLAYRVSQDLHTIQYYALTDYFLSVDRSNNPLNKKVCDVLSEVRNAFDE